jgi:hypothetical protein
MIRKFALLSVLGLLLIGSNVTFAADISVTAANVAPSAQARFTTQTAGVTITAGQTLYYDTASGTVKLAKANGASPVNTIYGIAMSNASANQPIVVCTYDPALAIGGTVAAGTVVWLSVVNAGGLSSTTADDVSGGTMTRIVLGVGLTGNKIFFQPITGGILP